MMKSQFIDYYMKKTQVIYYEETPSLIPLNLNKKKRERYSNQDFKLTAKIPKIQNFQLTPKVLKVQNIKLISEDPNVQKVSILTPKVPNVQTVPILNQIVQILSPSDTPIISDENEKYIRLYYSTSGGRFSKEELSINILDTVTKLFWNIESSIYPFKLVSIDICGKTLNETLHQENRNITIKSYFDNYDFQNNFIDIYSSIFSIY